MESSGFTGGKRVDELAFGLDGVHQLRSVEVLS
jgi:hypothetical protein